MNSNHNIQDHSVWHKSVNELQISQSLAIDFVVVVVVYFILRRLLYLAFSVNLGLLCMPHPGMGPLV